MRVLIIGDMEGVCAINHWDQVQPPGYLYEEGRTLYTNEINAAARGARAAGAETMVVIDSHGAGSREVSCKFNSIRPDMLDTGTEFVSHHRYMYYDDVLAEGFDACLFIGIHAMEGTPNGVLSHTISTKTFDRVEINGRPAGEIALMAALVGHFGIPMVMIAGDAAACAEAKTSLGDGVHTAAVKQGLSRYSARHLHPVNACRLIEKTAAEAVASCGGAKPYVPEAPVHIRIRVKSIDRIDEEFRNRAGVTIDDEKLIVETRADSWLKAWRTIYGD